MPILDPKAGYAAIWAVSCFLFISVAAGGGFLVIYMVLPESDSTYWLPIAGLTLVCLPWLFWLCTCLYRIISRLFGFRLSFGGDGGGGGGSGVNNNNQTVDDNVQETKEDSIRSRVSETPLIFSKDSSVS